MKVTIILGTAVSWDIIVLNITFQSIHLKVNKCISIFKYYIFYKILSLHYMGHTYAEKRLQSCKFPNPADNDNIFFIKKSLSYFSDNSLLCLMIDFP